MHYNMHVLAYFLSIHYGTLPKLLLYQEQRQKKENKINTAIELPLITDTDTPSSVLSASSFFNKYTPLTCYRRPFHCSLPLSNLYLASARSHGEDKEGLPPLSPGTKAEMTKNA